MERAPTPQPPTKSQIAISLGVFILVMSAAFGVARIQPGVHETLDHHTIPEKALEFYELQGDAGADVAEAEGADECAVEGVAGGAVEGGFDGYYYQYYTTIFTIWATLLLLIPAFGSFLLRHARPSAHGYWVLFWTLSLAAYLIHILWAALVAFDGNLGAIFTCKARVAQPELNTILALWWSLDVSLLFFSKAEPKWVRIQRWGIHVAVFAIAVVATLVVAKASGHVRILGILLVVSVVVCGMLAWRGRSSS